jgi:trigger factor
MQVSLETTGSLGRRLTIAVPSERLEKAFSAKIQRLSKTAKFPGFRPGKAPLKLVEAQYGSKVLQEVMGELIQSSFYEAVTEQGLKPAGGPAIQPKTIERGRDFEYIAEFEIYPEIGKLEISSSKIERPVCEVTEADVDRTIESLRKQRTTWQPVDRAAQMGDRANVDFKGFLNDVPFEGGEAKGFQLTLGSNALIDGFEEGLVGVKSGESRSLNVTFPADYRNTTLAGQAVRFDVQVHEINEPVLPELNAEFAAMLGIGDGGVDSLRKEVRNSLEREMRDRTRNLVRDQVFKAVIEANVVDVPKALEQAEIERMMESTRANLAAQGVPTDRIPNDPSLYSEQARRRVSLGLILAELVKVKGLIADVARVRSKIEEMAANYEAPADFIEWHYSQPNRLAEVESLVLEEQAIDLLLATAQLVDKPITFQELTQSPTPQG